MLNYNHKRWKRREEKSKSQNKDNKQKTATNMVDIKPTLLISMLNVNYLNISIKKQRLSECIKKYDPTLSCLQKNYFKIKTHRN